MGRGNRPGALRPLPQTLHPSMEICRNAVEKPLFRKNGGGNPKLPPPGKATSQTRGWGRECGGTGGWLPGPLPQNTFCNLRPGPNPPASSHHKRGIGVFQQDFKTTGKSGGAREEGGFFKGWSQGPTRAAVGGLRPPVRGKDHITWPCTLLRVRHREGHRLRG